MLARDRGCSYPGCDATTAWLEPTTSPTTTPPEEPASTTAPWSAAPTTTPSQNSAGNQSCSTATPTGSHPTGSTPTKSHDATICTTESDAPLHELRTALAAELAEASLSTRR